MLNRTDGTAIIEYISSCPKAAECSNDHCYFRRRDIHNDPVWAMELGSVRTGIEDEGDARQKKNRELYGERHYPVLEIADGTNALYVVCRSFRAAESAKLGR